MPEIDEDVYWQLFVDGDLDALSILFRSYVSSLVAYGLKIYPDEELVKDAIQDVFVQLIRKRKTINPNNNVRGFVFRLFRNRLIDEIKLINNKRKANQQLGEYFTGDFDLDAEHIRIAAEEGRTIDSAVASAIARLSPHQKEVLLLKYGSGLNYVEISHALKIDITSARTLVYRTLKQVKEQLADFRKEKSMGF
jgi:RNA polymerase sigma factor (sigma-70 family)